MHIYVVHTSIYIYVYVGFSILPDAIMAQDYSIPNEVIISLRGLT